MLGFVEFDRGYQSSRDPKYSDASDRALADNARDYALLSDARDRAASEVVDFLWAIVDMLMLGIEHTWHILGTHGKFPGRTEK